MVFQKLFFFFFFNTDIKLLILWHIILVLRNIMKLPGIITHWTEGLSYFDQTYPLKLGLLGHLQQSFIILTVLVTQYNRNTVHACSKHPCRKTEAGGNTNWLCNEADNEIDSHHQMAHRNCPECLWTCYIHQRWSINIDLM